MINPLNLLIKPSTVYHFAELLQKPYNQYEAYRKGIINDNGQFIAKTGDLDGLEYIALRVKSLFKDLMPGTNKFFLSTLSGTLKLFNEEFAEMGIDRSDVNVIIEAYLFNESNGNLSYLDYLLEEAQVRMIHEEMTAGAVGGLASPAHPTMQGGIASVDRPMKFGVKRRKKKLSKRIMEQAVGLPTDNQNPYNTIQVDPMDYEEIARASTPSGDFDPSQITTPELRKYLKRLSERTKKPVFVIGNAQQPPRMLQINRSRKS